MTMTKENPQQLATVGGSNSHHLATLSDTHEAHHRKSDWASQPITLTIFPDVYAKTKTERKITWGELVTMLRAPTKYPTKSACRLLKGATFGNIRVKDDCLRSDENMGAVSFIEGDYDDETFSMDEAVAALAAAGIEAVVYTTGRHTPERQRFRILALLSATCTPDARAPHVATLNGALGGRLAIESFTKSQTFFYGEVAGVEYRCVHVAGRPVDLDLMLTPVWPSPSSKVYESDMHSLPETINAETVVDITSAVRGLKASRADGYEECREVMQHLKHLEHCGHGELAEALAREFCERSAKYSDSWFDRKWFRQLHPWKGHFKTLFVLAQADGWVNPRKAVGADMQIQALSAQTREVTLSTWADAAAMLDPQGAADVLEAVHRQTGMAKRPLNASLREARAKLKRARKAGDAGGRVVMTYRPHDSAEQALEVEALILANGSTESYFVYAERLSLMVEAQMPHSHQIDNPDAPADPVPMISPHNLTTIRAYAERQVVFQIEGEKGPSNIGVPEQVVKNTLEMPSKAVPVVAGMLGHPVALHDGSILSTNGLDPRTKLFVHGLHDLSMQPYTQIEAEAAFARLKRNFLDGFEFASNLNAHIALAGLFTAVQRRLLDSAPGMAIMAPSQASGKTTLARRIYVVLTGRDMPVTSLPIGNEAELEKRLLSLLLGSPEMVNFDNVSDGLVVHGGALNAAMTMPEYTSRILGASQIVKAPTNTFFVLTGNNLRLGADEVTRWLVTVLAPSGVRPEERTFRHPDVVAHARGMRDQVLRDVVGIVAGFLRSGDDVELQMGTRFPQWDRMVRQPIIWAGGDDVAKSFTINSSEAEGIQALRSLLLHLREHFGEEQFSARAVASLAAGIGENWTGPNHDVNDALELLGAREPTKPRSVGKVLNGVLDRVVEIGGAPFQLRQKMDRNHTSSFEVRALRAI